ncbi:hypothetical protein K491DRAFT_581127, partial [Lophiostoma macrostomum CBS 122681]
LRRRLLQDIVEVQREPYPNIFLHIDEANLTSACLVLTPPDGHPLHLCIEFLDDYPLRAPRITIQSSVVHPNVYGDYICASILNEAEGWTPAYTLRGILIQLLSFFCSDSLEQDTGGLMDLKKFRAASQRMAGATNGCQCFLCRRNYSRSPFECENCGFHSDDQDRTTNHASAQNVVIGSEIRASGLHSHPQERSKLFEMSDEIILRLITFLDAIDIFAFGEALPTIKHMLHGYDIIRIRELQCFCLKKSHLVTQLGIGVSVTGGNRPIFRSEFDLLSDEAYNSFGIRKSIQGVEFGAWLPLPLSHGHWYKVRQQAGAALTELHRMAQMRNRDQVEVLYHFMNNIVVQFSSEADRSFNRPADQPDARSTLTHASEKAVESYFALFHLLLCIATEDSAIIASANRMVSRFIAGPRSKAYFPDLGHVLVAALISADGVTEDVSFHVIKEAILRNVVWMLDSKGAGMAELAYIEPSRVSDYRLTKTFEASRTSYRLLMFLKLFSSTARQPGKSLLQLHDELFDTHGAPPSGTSAIMAYEIRRIRNINNFPDFLIAMGISELPTKADFSGFLKRTIGDSVSVGYSCMPMDQSQLYMLRQMREPRV